MKSDVVAEQVIRLRKRAGWTREQLAARCAELGWPALTFGAISSIETGRRDAEGRRVRHVTVEEKNILAAALAVPPSLLEVPLGSAELVEVLPRRTVDTWTAYRWLIGEFPTEALDEQQDPTADHVRSDQAGETVNLYRQHHIALHGYLTHRSRPEVAGQYLTRLAAARVALHHRGGMWLPLIPDDVRNALQEQLRLWGYREDSPGQLVKGDFPEQEWTRRTNAAAAKEPQDDRWPFDEESSS